MPKSFILNDESRLNSHGFILLNAGGDFSRFRENPVMLDNHDPNRLVGRWENLRTEGSLLMADPVFDADDDNAKKLQGKVERGFLKGSSMGIYIKEAELRSIPALGLVPVATKWEAVEGSLTAVPSNAGSLALYNDRHEMITSAEAIQLSIDSLINKTNSETSMEKIILSAEAAKALNLTTEPKPDALSSAIVDLSARSTKAEDTLKTFLSARATDLVEGALKSGKITADKKESFTKLAMSDFDQAKNILDSMPGKQTFSDKTTGPGGKDKGRDDWDYMKWAKEDPKGLAELKAKDPQKFDELRSNYKPVN